MSVKLITKQPELDALCKAAATGKFATVDTEFIRDRTYYPKLCLLQIAGEHEAAIIDPLSPGIDMAPVFALLQNPGVVKVFHAARQDIEIFYMLSGKIPAPIFDTQIAAAVCGYGESVSYETLVNKIAHAEIDKSSRFTDWSARPLSDRQLQYALSDVTYLRAIYDVLHKKIEDAGRSAWIEEEHAFLSDPALYRPEPEDAWKRLKFGNMRPKHLVVLRELAKWREIEAREADVPRGRILKDETLIELALASPRKEADLSRMRGIGNMSRSRAEAILGAVEAALALPASEYPQSRQGRRPQENVTAAVAMLQLLLKVQSDAHDVAAPMIAGKDDLESIALGKSDSPALHGWRRDIFGQKAESLMRGKLKMSLNPKNKQVAFEETTT